MATAADGKHRARRHKGEGSIYQRSSDGRWVGAVDLGKIGGKRRRKTITATTLRELQAKMKAARKLIEAGILPTNATVEQWMRHWLDHIAARTVRPGTLPSYESKTRVWIIPLIGNIELQKLTPADVRQMYTAMEKAGASDSMVRHVRAVLRNALAAAVDDQRLDSNAAQAAKLKRVGKAAKNHHAKLSVEQARLVIAAARDARELTRLTCALVLGMRQGEALGLRWRDIHLGDTGGWIDLREGIRRVKGQGLVRTPVKSAASERRIPLPAPVAVVFRTYREVCDTEHLFPGARDWPMEPGRDWQAWKAALERAGVPHVPLHGARGTAASVLLSMGVPDRYIADILGHSNVTITEESYLHSDEQQRLDALGRLADHMALPATVAE